MNYFKAAEELLSKYNVMKQSFENLEHQKQKLILAGCPQELKAFDFSKPYVDSSYINDTYGDALDFLDIARRQRFTACKIEEVERVINQLSPQNRSVIELWYFERKTKSGIASDLSYSSLKTIYKHRNAAVSEFALLYYGANTLDSI